MPNFFAHKPTAKLFLIAKSPTRILEYDLPETLNDTHINMSQPGIFLVPKIPAGESYPRHTEPTALTTALVEVAGWHDDTDELRMMKRIFDLLAKIKSSAHISQAGRSTKPHATRNSRGYKKLISGKYSRLSGAVKMVRLATTRGKNFARH